MSIDDNGLPFSLHDLWAVRAVANLGALIQIATATALGFTLTQRWGWTIAASLVLGFAVSIARTVSGCVASRQRHAQHTFRSGRGRQAEVSLSLVLAPLLFPLPPASERPCDAAMLSCAVDSLAPKGRAIPRPLTARSASIPGTSSMRPQRQ
jgi:CPA2 family monovalent cation:H+ antiporter-2